MTTYVPVVKNGANGAIFYISLTSQATPATFQANPTLATGDAKVSIDGAALANLGTLPAVTPASSKLVKVTLSQSEVNGDNIQVILSDAAGAEWCDYMHTIQTTARQIDDLAYPTTSGRSIDVTTTGEVGIDWSNVGAPTTTLALTGTTIAATQKVDVETIKTNPVVNAGTVTFPTTATLASTTNITAGTVTTATNVTTVNGLAANVITATSINADAITAAKVADGTIDAATFAAGAINAAAIAADAITAAKIADGAIDAATFAAGAINAAAIAADAITDAKVAADVTIASVTGAVGSVAGAVGSVTGNVGGNVTGSVGSIATGGIAAASFASGAIDATAIAANAIGASELAADAVAEIADGILDRDMSTGVDSGSTTVRTPRQALRALRNKWSISGTTITFTKENDVTASHTAELTTDGAADPVTASDPAGP